MLRCRRFMHIPDGFLSTPVWLSLDVASVSAIGYIGRKAQREAEETKAPLLGVMGAFVFAAQMINFPVGPGTSGHLVGSALLAYTLGPAAAAIVMTAVLALQALIFQDGGLLALGANVFNMALVGVLVAMGPYRLWGSGRIRNFGVFAGAFLSVFVGACLALLQIYLSGVALPTAAVWVALGLFAVTAVLEGIITVAVIGALNRLNPGWVRQPAAASRRVLSALVVGAVLLVTVGVLFASTNPDGLEHFAEQIGIAEQARALVGTPLADYQVEFVGDSWLSQTLAGAVGLVLVFFLCLGIARLVSRGRRA